MPFREKAKNLFKGSKTRNSSISQASSDGGSNHDVYKPGEAMPPPKYRRPPLKEHTEKLESFSFADAWRKKSFQSSHSPMGTRAQSRRPSMISMGRRSFGRKSTGSVSDAGRTASVGSVHAARDKDTAAGASRLTPEPEQEGDDDVTNVGLSRAQSKKGNPPHGLHKVRSTAHDHTPFSEQDLANALQRSQFEVAAH